jgi:hypothetical protein
MGAGQADIMHCCAIGCRYNLASVEKPGRGRPQRAGPQVCVIQLVATVGRAMTAEEVADVCGVSRQAVAQWESAAIESARARAGDGMRERWKKGHMDENTVVDVIEELIGMAASGGRRGDMATAILVTAVSACMQARCEGHSERDVQLAIGRVRATASTLGTDSAYGDSTRLAWMRTSVALARDEVQDGKERNEITSPATAGALRMNGDRTYSYEAAGEDGRVRIKVFVDDSVGYLLTSAADDVLAELYRMAVRRFSYTTQTGQPWSPLDRELAEEAAAKRVEAEAEHRRRLADADAAREAEAGRQKTANPARKRPGSLRDIALTRKPR